MKINDNIFTAEEFEEEIQKMNNHLYLIDNLHKIADKFYTMGHLKGIKENVIMAEIRTKKRIFDKINSIIAEFGDDPKQCLIIIDETLNSKKEDIR